MVDSKKGLTMEFRQSQEYKEWFNAIKHDYPKLPDYLIDTCIEMHLHDPKLYQKGYAIEKKLKSELPEKVEKKTIYDEAIMVVDAPEEPPEVVEVREVKVISNDVTNYI